MLGNRLITMSEEETRDKYTFSKEFHAIYINDTTEDFKRPVLGRNKMGTILHIVCGRGASIAMPFMDRCFSLFMLYWWSGMFVKCEHSQCNKMSRARHPAHVTCLPIFVHSVHAQNDVLHKQILLFTFTTRAMRRLGRLSTTRKRGI